MTEREKPTEPNETPPGEATEEREERDEAVEEAAESSSALLERLLADGLIALESGSVLQSQPSPQDRPDLRDRIEGMLLGLAIGDSLGNTTEGLTPQMRVQIHGEVREYLPTQRSRWQPVGLPTDDTQLAFRTVEQLLEDGRLIPDNLARRFCAEPIHGGGGTVSQFVHNYGNLGMAWHAAGPRSAGNGALMRIAPVLLPHLREPSPELWADTAVAAMLTHNDPASTGACVALVSMLWEVLRMDAPPPAQWWLDSFVAMLRELEGETAYHPRSMRFNYEGPVWEFTEMQVRDALQRDETVLNACDEWLSGAYLLETIPSFLYVLCRHADDPAEAIVRAVNDTTDNDTIGAIVGAVVGALHGRGKLPESWIERLSGRLAARDDGRVFQLLEQACQRWVPSLPE